MHQAVVPRSKAGKARPDSFSLVELLVVMAIIAILVAITLQAVSGVLNISARSRARSEVKAMEAALEGYKTDNGIYLPVFTMTTNQYTTVDVATATNYTYPAQMLYQALSGKTNYLDNPVAGVKSYGSFKVNQLGNAKAAAGSTPPSSTYLQDPWSFPYGYSTGSASGATTNAPYNGIGYFDLWSTGGLSLTSATYTNTAAWIANWQL